MAVWPNDVNARIFNLWSSNLLLSLLPFLGGDDSVVNCIAGELSLQDGVASVRSFLIDTTQVQVKGRGRANLASRKINLDLRPRPKRPRFLSLSTPLTVRGTLKDPDISVGAGGFVKTAIRLYYSLIIFPIEWLTQKTIPEDNSCQCRIISGRHDRTEPHEGH